MDASQRAMRESQSKLQCSWSTKVSAICLVPRVRSVNASGSKGGEEPRSISFLLSCSEKNLPRRMETKKIRSRPLILSVKTNRKKNSEKEDLALVTFLLFCFLFFARMESCEKELRPPPNPQGQVYSRSQNGGERRIT